MPKYVWNIDFYRTVFTGLFSAKLHSYDIKYINGNHYMIFMYAIQNFYEKCVFKYEEKVPKN